MNHTTARQFLFLALAALYAGPAASRSAELWGNNRGCLRFSVDRRARLAFRAVRIPTMTDRDAFTLRFRFRTLGPHAYGALGLIGIRAHSREFLRDAAGVILHRHSKRYGLVGYPFIANEKGNLCIDKAVNVRLQYDTVYDAVCTYSPKQHTISVTFLRPGHVSASSALLNIPPGTTWHANRLAVWNYADGQPTVARSAALMLLIDNLRLNGNALMTFDHDLSELNEYAGDNARWDQGPEPPLFSKFTGPRDVFPGESAGFRVQVRDGAAGTVSFDLQQFDGTPLLHCETRPAANRMAAVEFASDALSALEQGETALVVSMPGRSQPWVHSVFLHGHVFRNVVTEPAEMQPGDEIVIDDMALCGPAAAIRPDSTKGAWWRRKYGLPGEKSDRKTAGHEMLCVEEHDPDAPDTCLAPAFRLPLELHGWYEIWVTMVRPERGGGIDVRLSREEYFRHLDPVTDTTATGEKGQGSRLVEMRFRAADLTGQHLVFQQPHGTFESEFKLCNASFAGVRLVRLTDEQVTRLRAEFANPENQRIGFDNDGYSYFWKWATHDPACVARLFEPLRTPSASFLNVSIGGLGGLTIPTPYTGLYQLRGHTRDGDYRANEFFRWCQEHDADIVQILAKRAHRLGKKLFISSMMERCYSPDRFVREHPDWRIARGRGVWDYANPEVRAYQIRKIAWICAHRDIDGFIVDFTRYGHYFNRDEPRKFELMNIFVRDLRAAIDRANGVKKRKVLLCASFGDRSWHLLHWGTGRLDDQGLDIQTWIRENWFDVLLPEGPTCLDFVKMAAGTRTQVWPRKVKGVALESSKGVQGKLDSRQITAGLKRAFDAGADGVFFFNHEPRTSFGRLGIRRELRLRALTDAVYGLRAGSAITFVDWFPGFKARQRQRQSFIPAAVGMRGNTIDVRVRLPIRNTFEHVIEARTQWEGPALDAGIEVTPETASIRIEPGATTEISTRIRGTCPEKLHTEGIYAAVTFHTGHAVVFRGRVPVRLTSAIACELRKDGAPTFVPLGAPPPCPIRIAAGKDALILEWVPGQDARRNGKTLCAHDDFHRLQQGTYLDIRVDTDGREQRFAEFAVGPAGEQCEAVWTFDSFLGRHARKTAWNGEWNTEMIPAGATKPAKVRITLPFKTLGDRPAPGKHWRLVIVVHNGKHPVFSWPADHNGSPNRFGVLTFR